MKNMEQLSITIFEEVGGEWVLRIGRLDGKKSIRVEYETERELWEDISAMIQGAIQNL